MQDAFDLFSKNRYPSQDSKAKAEATGSNSNASVQSRKRKNVENIVVESKKKKLNEHSVDNESPSTSNIRENEQNMLNTSLTNTCYKFGCCYCDDPNTWTENSNEILDHLTTSHSLNNSDPPFLFRVVQRNNESFESITLENSELNDLLSIEEPSHGHSN